ncbi:MAG: hypothetical protein CM1200mP21_05640 [Candidatus Poseidoniales archaeon]|nr:MAG: hypothetical protein CM1200mP21_05640 [Candidatus Poseidoniales archaeon]
MSSHPPSLMQKMFSNPLFRTFLIFSIFRAFYGAGILVVTWFLATSGDTPWWSSIIFLLFSMVFSRMLFRRIKLRWPHLFETSQDPVV